VGAFSVWPRSFVDSRGVTLMLQIRGKGPICFVSVGIAGWRVSVYSG